MILHSLPLAGLQSALGAQEMIIIVLMLAFLALWLFCLVHCIRNKRLSDTNRIIGVVLIVVLGFIGCLIYPFLPRE